MDKFDLMLSYSHNSKEITWKIFEWFKKHGFTTWIDKEYLNTDLAKNISTAIDSTSVFIPCLSYSYEQSDWCMRELKFAFELKKHIVPIIVEDGYQMNNEVKLHIAGKKYFTLRTQDFEGTMNEVLKAVKEYLSSTPTKKRDVPAIQDEQQAADVKSDGLVLNNTDVHIIRQPGLKESCDKGISVTSNEKEMKNQKKKNDLPGEFSNLDLNESAKMLYERTNPDGSETKPIQCSNNISDKSSTNIPQKSSAVNDSVKRRENFEKEHGRQKLELSLDEIRYEIGIKVKLETSNNVLNIADHINIKIEDRTSITFADHGGGNKPYTFLEILRMCNPSLKIASFRQHLARYFFNEAEEFLSKYNDEKFITDVSLKDLKELSFKLSLLSGSNVVDYRPLAVDLGISKDIISRIETSGKYPAIYSRMEKLFDSISKSFPEYTIRDFLITLEELEILDVHKLILDKFIAKK